jgi:hypothetical protein
MILRLSLNEMDLQRSKQMLALLQRQPDHLRPIFSHGRATADLMDANDPIRSDQLQHDPPLHPELPATTTGRSHSTPHVLDGLENDSPPQANDAKFGGRLSHNRTGEGLHFHRISEEMNGRIPQGGGLLSAGAA